MNMIGMGLRLIGRDCLIIKSMRPYTLSETTNKSILHIKAISSPLLYNHSFDRKFTSVLPSDVAVAEQSTGVSESPLVRSILDSLQQFDFDEIEVKRIIEKQPTLVNYSITNWVNLIKLLSDSNFTNSSIYKMLEKCPELLSMSTSNIHKGLMCWCGSGMSTGLYIEVLTTHPSFLKLDHKFVSKRIEQFRLHLEGKNRAGRLFLIAPTTMTQSMTEILKKINYLDELCKDKEDLVMSAVLDYNIFHIKARHEFLIRAGLYKRPSKNYDRRLDKNPKLEKIVNSTNEDFVKMLTPLTLFEYEVFLEMYKKELDIESDSDSDSEENLKNSYAKHKIKRKRDF